MNAAAIQIQASRSRRERRQQRILVVCLAGSLAAHVVGYGWLASRKVPPVAKRVPDGFMMVESWPAPQVAAPGGAGGAGGEVGKPVGEAAGPPGAPAKPGPRATPAPAPVDVAGEVQRKGILRALGSLGRGPAGKGLPGALASADAPSGLPDAPRARGVDGGGLPERRGGGGGGPAALGDLGLRGIGKGGTGVGTGAGGMGLGGGAGGGPGGSSVGIGRGQVGSTEVDQARLDAFVRARLGGLRACYENQLKLDARSDGTLRMRFAIQSSGELSGVAAAENSVGSDVMADCLVRIVRTWRTPFRPSEPVQVEYPFVFRPSRE